MPELTMSNVTGPAGSDLIVDMRNHLSILRRGWRLIAISVLVCLTLAALYLARTKRIYQATARLLVLQQGGRPLNVANNDPARVMEGADDYLSTHSVVIRSPMVVARAIDELGLEDLPSLDSADPVRSPVEQAIRNLAVARPDRFAKILRVDYQAGSRAEAVRMVTAITHSYQQFLDDSYQKNNTGVIKLVAKAKDELKKELDTLEDEYVEFRRENPALIADEKGRSFIARRLDQWDLEANEAMVKEVKLREQLELGRKLSGAGTGLWAIVHAMNQLVGPSNGGLGVLDLGLSQSQTADYLRQLGQEQQQLAERFGPQYSKVRELQDQIVRVQERMRDSRGRLDRFDTNDLLGAIEQSLKGTESLRAELEERFNQDMAEAKETEVALLEEENLHESLERQRALFNTVVDQLKQAQLVSDYASISSQVIEPPNAPSSPIYPRMSLTLALALMAGCVVGSGAAVVADRLDTRIRTTAEIRRILDLPVLGLIPQLTEDQIPATGAVGLISQAMPRSLWAEAYRSARTSLEFLRRAQRLPVILVTSPCPGDGKSTTASNLAISLAQAGRKVLLVDADLRRPTQDTIHNLSRDRGMVQVLRDLMSIEQVVQKSAVENLDVITVGPDVHNPAELLTSPRLAEFLDEARQSYHTVIVDSSPLLAVADASIIGGSVDGIVLIVRAATVRRHDAERAAEILKALGTPVLGTLINGIGPEHGGQGYGYGYGTYGTYGSSRTAEPADLGLRAEFASPKHATSNNGTPEPPGNG